METSCKELIKRDKYILDRISAELGIDYDINLLMENNFISVFESYEEKRERLRIIGVMPQSFTSLEDKNKTKRVQIFSISKRKIKEKNFDIHTLRLKAKLYATVWKQLKLLKEIETTEGSINSIEQQLQKCKQKDNTK